MRKAIRTESWRTFFCALLSVFVIGSFAANELSAQTSDNDYVISTTVTNVNWDYQGADAALGFPTVSLTPPGPGQVALPGFDPLSIVGIIDVFVSVDELPGDFVITAGGNIYTASGDVPGTAVAFNTSDYVSEFGAIEDVLNIQVIEPGDIFTPFSFNFQAFENDCQGAVTFDVSSSEPCQELPLSAGIVGAICDLTGGLCDIPIAGAITEAAIQAAVDAALGAILIDPSLGAFNDEVITTANPEIDYFALVDVDADGQPIPGTYGPFTLADTNLGVAALPDDLGEGATFGMEFFITVGSPDCIEDPANPLVLTIDENCQGVNQLTGIDQGQIAVTVTGGTAPYEITGSGIFLDGDLTNVLTPIENNGGLVAFVVLGNTPWSVMVTDANGCVVGEAGSYDIPPSDFVGLPGFMCIDDPILPLIPSGAFGPIAPADIIPGSEFTATCGGCVFQGPDGTWFFDSFVAGTSRHTVSYSVPIPGCAGAGGETTTTSQSVTVYPIFAQNDYTVTNNNGAGNTQTVTVNGTALTIVTGPEAGDEVLSQSGVPALVTCEGGDVLDITLDFEGNISNLFIQLGGDASVGGVGAVSYVGFNPMNTYITWTGPGITDLNDGSAVTTYPINSLDGTGAATFDPAAAGVGTHTVNLNIGFTQCPLTETFAVTVVPTPDATLNQDIAVCAVEGDVYNLGEVFFTDDTTPGGVWYVVAEDGTVLVDGVANAAVAISALVAGQTHGIVYVVGDPNTGCVQIGESTLEISPLQLDAGFAIGDNNNDDFTNVLCSTETPIDMTLDTPAELLNFVGNGNDAGDAGETFVATTSFAIPAEDALTEFGFVTGLEITIDYTPTDAAAQGDHDGFNVIGPGGVTILINADGVGPNGDNHFDELVIPFEDIVAAYGSVEALQDALECDNDPNFIYSLVSNADDGAISIEADLSYTNVYGEFEVSLNETGEVIPAEAISFDIATGQFTFNTQFVTAAGQFYDLAAFDEIEVCHNRVGDCTTELADGTRCESSECQTFVIITQFNANIDGTLCLDGFDPVHLPGAFFMEGMTTPGGIWSIADESIDGVSEVAGTGVFGDMFYPASLAPGTYTVCYSAPEGAFTCDVPALAADCATIEVPTNYCVELAEDVVCENCGDEGLVEIVVGVVDPVTGDCVEITEGDLNVGINTVSETFSVCRSEFDNDVDGTTFDDGDLDDLRPTTLDAFDLGAASSVAICNDDPATFANVEGLFTVIENEITLPAGANIDQIVFNYNYTSATGFAQGDHDGWGVFFLNQPTCAAGSTYPAGAVIDSTGSSVGFADNADPDGDNHFPAAFPSTAFEVAVAGSAHVAAVQDLIDNATDCSVTFSYYYIVASNSQFWDACFQVDVDYSFENPSDAPTIALEAVFHEPSESGTLVPLHPDFIVDPPILANDTNGNEIADEFFLNTCGLGAFDEISIVLNVAQAESTDGCNPGAPAPGCYAEVISDVIVVLEGDGNDCSFTTDVSPAVCAGDIITLVPNGVVGTITWVNGVAVEISDADPATPGVQFAAAATSGPGIYTIVHTYTSDAGCVCTHEEAVLVNDVPTVTVPTDVVSICADDLPIDLTQYVDGSSSNGGTFADADGNAIVGVAGQLLLSNFTSGTEICYTISDDACDASACFTVNVSEFANADFDVNDTFCEGTTVDFADYFTSLNESTDGMWSVDGTSLAGSSFTFPTPGNYEVSYVTNAGTPCADVDAQIVTILGADEVAVEEYGFVCQSEDDFSIDLTAYLGNGSGVANGGTFTMGATPPFVSEIEYSNTNTNLEYVEVTAPEGTDMSCYALYFYDRTSDGKASGRVYDIIELTGVVGSTNSAPDPLFHNDYNAVDDNGVDIISNGATVTASNGISYGSIAYDPEFDIIEGAAGIALVNICQAYDRLADAGVDGYTVGNSPADLDVIGFNRFLKKDLDYRNNDDVVQFIGYGTSADATNDGIFAACDGPASTMTTIDINVVDEAANGNRSVQFTNNCWQVPNITDAPLDYSTVGPWPNNSGVTENNAGVLNWGLSEAGADELYWNYIAPDGDILNLDRICWSVFAVNQNVGAVTTPAGIPNTVGTQPGNAYKHYAYTGAIEEAGVDNEQGLDEGVVRFNCSNPVYTLPFGYELTTTTCGSNQATFFLTVLMDIEEDWNAPEEPICATDDAFELYDLIDDDVHYIQPYHQDGSWEDEETQTYDENAKPPFISELNFSWYDLYSGESADDHCILYNYVDNAGTPFDVNDDFYASEYICEGIEISAPTGTDLSCYSLVFFTNTDVDAGNEPNALGQNIAYIDENGMLAETDIVNGVYMSLYGTIDEDPVSDGDAQSGQVMYVPTFAPDAFPGNPGFPFYAGAFGSVPYNQNTAFGLNNEPAASGLYEDVNGNDAYDEGIDTPLAATDFPWERNGGATDGVGSRWFPISDIPDNVGGVGFWNNCTGELLEFISWGDADPATAELDGLCVEPQEDFSLATGPFEQLSSTVIDTTQNINNSLGDIRTLQLVHCSDPAFAAQLASCDVCQDDENASTWAIVYNGGAATIPLCGNLEIGTEETELFSNTIGFYNTLADQNWFDKDNYTFEFVPDYSDLPEDAVVTSHIVEVIIGTGNAGELQVFTFNIAGDCGVIDVSENTNVNEGTDVTPAFGLCDLGDLAGVGSGSFTQNEVCEGCADANDNACIPGQFLDGGGEDDYDWDDTVDGFDGANDFSPTDDIALDDPQGPAGEPDNVNDGLYEIGIYDGVGEDTNLATFTDGECYVGSCTGSLTDDTFVISDLSAYLYDGNQINGSGDTCRTFERPLGSFDVTIRVKVEYMQCTPTGNWHTVLDGAPEDPMDFAPMYENNLSDGPIVMNTENFDNPFWTLDPAAISAEGLVDLEVTYDVTNFNTIEADDVTDDLACLDDDNDNIREQEITVVNPAPAVIPAGVPAAVCADADAVMLPGAGTWSGDGVTGNMFDPAGLSGAVMLEYATADAACSGAAMTTVMVNTPIAVSVGEATFNEAAGTYTVTLDIAGGNGTYTVNGMPYTAGDEFTTACGSGYTFVVDGDGSCGAVTVTGEEECPCDLDAGTLNVVADNLFCAPDGVTASVTGADLGSCGVGVFAITSGGDVIQTSSNGNFGSLPFSGTYNVWHIVFDPADFPTGLPTTVAEIAAAADPASGLNIVLAGPVEIQVVNDLELSVVAVCDSIIGGYVLQVTVDGGAPAANGAGSYDITPEADNPLDLFVTSPDDLPVTAIVTNGGGPFAPDQIVAVSVDSDGSLCQAAVEIIVPNDACGTGVTPDAQNTSVGAPVSFNVLDNDTGFNLEVSNVIFGSEDGDLVWDADGNFTFVPAPGTEGSVVTITYEVTNQFGYTTIGTVEITVAASGALSVDDTRDCTPVSNGEEFYTVFVDITGGVGPYTIDGTYNGVVTGTDLITFSVTNGEGYVINVTDALGTSFMIDKSDIESCTKVAIELVRYIGVVEEEGNFLEWVTASEVNNDFFTLEHSTDGVEFSTIATVQGNGTTSTSNTYSFLHADAPAGLSYYRLGSTDFDGTTYSHGTITLVRGQVDFGIVNVFPVPTSSELNVNFTAATADDVRLEVYNVAGQIVAVKEIEAFAGMNATTLNVEDMATGSYFLTINNGTDVSTVKFIVE